MTLTNREMESMDEYFKRKGLSRLWDNLKLFVETSAGSGNTGGGNTGSGNGNTGSGNQGGNTGNDNQVSGNFKTFKRKLPFVEMHFSESFLTDILGYETVEQALEWLPYRNKVSLGSARYPTENQSFVHRSSIPNTLALYKGSHQSKTTRVDANSILKSFDTSVYEKLDGGDDTQYSMNYTIMYFRNGEYYESSYYYPELTEGEEIVKYQILPSILNMHYLPLSTIVESAMTGSANYEVICLACRLKKDQESFFESDDENIRNLARLFTYYDLADEEKPKTVQEVYAKFEELLSKIDPAKVHSATYFNIFDETKLDDYISEPFNTHVFRFIPDNYPYHSTGGQVTRVELYPNKEDFRYVFGNTNVNSNAYLIDSSLLNEERDIAITDTINDDLEEIFTEVYPCV